MSDGGELIESTLTLAEAARRAGVSTTTLRRWIRAGQIPEAVEHSSGYRIPVASLAAAGLLTARPKRTEPSASSSPNSTGPTVEVLTALNAQLLREVDYLRRMNEQLVARIELAPAPPPSPADQLIDLRASIVEVLAGLQKSPAPAPVTRRRWFGRRTK
jgi:excisionase family DNA binding protein